MAIRSGFFDAVGIVNPDNSITYDRAYFSSEYAAYFARFISNGVFMEESTNLQVMASETPDMKVTIKAGWGWIFGYWVHNDSDFILNVDVADASLSRKDIIVFGMKYADRTIDIYLKKGTPSASPASPSLQRDADYYEMEIAEISVNAGIVNVTSPLINDTRLDLNVCGIVTGLIDHVDTTTLYNQIQSDLAGFKTVNEADFTAWVASIKDVLDEETAGNLLNLINEHKADTAAHVTQAEKNKISLSVPNTRKVNNKALTNDITLNAADVGLGNVNNTADANKSVNYANSAGSAPANGGTSAACSGNSATAGVSNYAHYSSHAVGSGGAALRNITMSTGAPSGGQDGDVWHQYK